MDKILTFLQNSNGDRLFWYGLVFLIALGIVGGTLVEIFRAIANVIKYFRKNPS